MQKLWQSEDTPRTRRKCLRLDVGCGQGKYPLLKWAAVLFIVVGSLASCEKKEKNGTTPQESIVHDTIMHDTAASVVGQWKLTKVEIPFVGEKNDYSQHNVVYEFKANGTLTITKEGSTIENYRGHSIGEHAYSFAIDEDLLYHTLGVSSPATTPVIRIDEW